MDGAGRVSVIDDNNRTFCHEKSIGSRRASAGPIRDTRYLQRNPYLANARTNVVNIFIGVVSLLALAIWGFRGLVLGVVVGAGCMFVLGTVTQMFWGGVVPRKMRKNLAVNLNPA